MPGANTDGAVVLQIGVRGTAIEFDGERTLLQLARLSRKRFFHHMAQERPAPFAALEFAAREDISQFRPQFSGRLPLGRREWLIPGFPREQTPHPTLV